MAHLASPVLRSEGLRAIARMPSPARRARSRPQAIPLHHAAQIISQISEAGDVEAPPYVVFAVYDSFLHRMVSDREREAHSEYLRCNVGAALVTLVGGAIIPLALKPGQEAADQMQDRDSNKWKS